MIAYLRIHLDLTPQQLSDACRAIARAPQRQGHHHLPSSEEYAIVTALGLHWNWQHGYAEEDDPGAATAHLPRRFSVEGWQPQPDKVFTDRRTGRRYKLRVNWNSRSTVRPFNQTPKR